MQINVEYYNQTAFRNFFSKIENKTLAVMYDVNTKPYADNVIKEIKLHGARVLDVYYADEELVPTEDKCDYACQISANADYVLAVGSGTLNDMAKSVSTRLKIPCGVLATAASMDGYCSKGSALMRGGFKVTDEVHTPEDVLIDLQIVCNAPRLMTAAGFGDIIGKFTCLTDWKLANIIKCEPINEQAFFMMEQARTAVMQTFDGLVKNDETAVAKLMDALIVAGTSMAICGNSRPASGSEHHQSHFLEMDFVSRNERIPMHGIKVAIGTLVSISLYNYLKDNQIKFDKYQQVYKLIEKLPSVSDVENMLKKMGCPTRFSEIGVRKQTMEEMLEKAHTVRDRYTILTFINELGLTQKIKPYIMERFY